MELIGKTRLLDYIDQYPDAETALLTWLIEFDYVDVKRLDKQINERPVLDIIHCESILNNNFRLRYLVNPWFKTACITWFGTNEELQAYNLAEIEKYKAANPGVTLVSKTFTFTATAQSPKSSSVPLIKPLHQTDVLTNPVVEAIIDDNNISLYAQNEYAIALERAIAIFKAKPETIEFNELATLLPSLRKYERAIVKFPKLSILDVIKVKMSSCRMEISWITKSLAESEEGVRLFLDGKKVLRPAKMKWLLKFLRMDYAIDNPALFD